MKKDKTDFKDILVEDQRPHGLEQLRGRDFLQRYLKAMDIRLWQEENPGKPLPKDVWTNGHTMDEGDASVVNGTAVIPPPENWVDVPPEPSKTILAPDIGKFRDHNYDQIILNAYKSILNRR